MLGAGVVNAELVAEMAENSHAFCHSPGSPSVEARLSSAVRWRANAKMPFVVPLDVSLYSLQASCRSGTLSPFLIASNKAEKD